MKGQNTGAINKVNSPESNLRLHPRVTSSNDEIKEQTSPIGNNKDEETNQTLPRSTRVEGNLYTGNPIPQSPCRSQRRRQWKQGSKEIGTRIKSPLGHSPVVSVCDCVVRLLGVGQSFCCGLWPMRVGRLCGAVVGRDELSWEVPLIPRRLWSVRCSSLITRTSLVVIGSPARFGYKQKPKPKPLTKLHRN